MADEDDFDMQPVASTQIDSVGYNEETKELRVSFQNGSLYSYSGVPRSIYDGLLTAPSVGQFFNYSVKHGFPFRRLE